MRLSCYLFQIFQRGPHERPANMGARTYHNHQHQQLAAQEQEQEQEQEEEMQPPEAGNTSKAEDEDWNTARVSLLHVTNYCID